MCSSCERGRQNAISIRQGNSVGDGLHITCRFYLELFIGIMPTYLSNLLFSGAAALSSGRHGRRAGRLLRNGHFNA